MCRSLFAVCLRLLFALALVGFAFLPTTQAQQVQFIHVSANAEVAAMDVYRDGQLWLDDFAFAQATPFEEWGPARQFKLDFTWADAPDASDAFFSTTLTLETPDSLFIATEVPGIAKLFSVQPPAYILAVAGDPLQRPGQPPFDLFVMNGALDSFSFYPPFPSVSGFHAAPDLPRWIQHWRGTFVGRFVGQIDLYPRSVFGDFQPYVTAPTVMYDGDIRGIQDTTLTPPFPFNLVDAELRQRYDASLVPGPDIQGPVYASVISNFANKHYLPFIIIEAGFLHPPREQDARFRSVMVFPTGATEVMARNVARLQWIHNAPYREASSVDLYINGFLVVDDLDFREATPLMELPSGLAHYSAPTLQVDVTAADALDNSDPLYSESMTLLFGETYAVVLTGDPLERTDQPPMDLHLSPAWREQAADSGRVDLLFAHGVPDMIGASLGIEGQPLPLAGFVNYGAFEEVRGLQPGDEVFTLARAETQEALARVEPELLSRGLADSALVVLTSGFIDPPEGFAAEDSELALLAALPSGGPLLRFTMRPPPLQPFWYIVGLFALAVVALVGYQVRLWRLRAHARELNTLVEERTRELQAEKQKTEEQAHRLLELDEAKNRFFANISHEFRTPLTLILGPLQDALDGVYKKTPARLEKQFPIMHRNARRLLRLINQLLDLSRLESGKLELHPEPVDLVPFVQNLTRAFVPLAERRRLTLHFHTDIDTLPLAFDPDAIEKVVTNLVSNALKFTPEGGKVLVTLKKDSSHAMISVKDTGPGITEEDLKRIFDRFQQGDTSTRRKYEGSGVGLTLAKELAELHGGTLEVESEVDFGSTFTVCLPLPETLPVVETAAVTTNGQPNAPLLEEAVLNTVDEQPFTQPDGKCPTVLIVEDNPDVRIYLRDHLEADYDLLEAEDGERGLALAQAYTPDLVLADVMMPKMDGYELCRLIKANDDLRHIPVVMLTAKAAERDTVEGLESGADDYLAKPFSVTELKARLSNLLTSRREMREKYSREVVVRPADITITPEEEVFLDRVLEVVNEHLGDANFTVDWLAGEVGLSRRQLERKVEAVTGETPSALIRRLRLERASQLLRARAGTVAEVSYAVGFRSPSHFSGVFRTAYGTSPTEHIES